MQDDTSRVVAQRVLAHALDTLLRLLHPIIPFITEEVWQLLGKIAPQRGLTDPVVAADSIMIADWPEVNRNDRDEQIERQFAKFQAALGAVREIRSRQNIPPKEPVDFCIRCEKENVELLTPLRSYFQSMANAMATEIGPAAEPPATNAAINVDGMDVYVDLEGFIDRMRRSLAWQD